VKYALTLQNLRSNGATWRDSINTLQILCRNQIDPLRLAITPTDAVAVGNRRSRKTALDWLREARLGLWYSLFLGTLAQGMAAAGQTAEARMVIDEVLERCDRSEGRWCLPELLRIKGELPRLDQSATAVKAAEDHYLQALEWARRQEALSWELRAATSRAKLSHERRKSAEAEQLLSSVYNKFSEGFETSDLKTARALIHVLRRSRARS
jgi:predicted ATPase